MNEPAKTLPPDGVDGEATVKAALDQLLADYPPDTTPEVEFLGAQFDAGLAWVHFPVGHGGLGLSRRYQPLIRDRIAATGATFKGPALNPIGYGMAAPTILAQGSEELRKRYLRPLFTCEEIWCQLFSEPGAGSDVAGLSTHAVRDGDDWVVNGQKCWTSLAHVADFGMLLARTDPDVPKHRGLTYFVVDMKDPGVEVRPLRQMTGDAEFNEVFFHDVRIHHGQRLSEVGDGWKGAIVTLMNERVSIGNTVTPRGGGPIARTVDLWEHADAETHNAARRDHVAQLWALAEVQRLTNLRAAAASRLGTPGPEGSIGKLAGTELNKKVADGSMDILGADGLLYESYEMRRPGEANGRGANPIPQRAFLRSRANSIEGGTSEIMRNILAERVLGLPGEIRVDKDTAWTDIPRG